MVTAHIEAMVAKNAGCKAGNVPAHEDSNLNVRERHCERNVPASQRTIVMVLSHTPYRCCCVWLLAAAFTKACKIVNACLWVRHKSSGCH